MTDAKQNLDVTLSEHTRDNTITDVRKAVEAFIGKVTSSSISVGELHQTTLANVLLNTVTHYAKLLNDTEANILPHVTADWEAPSTIRLSLSAELMHRLRAPQSIQFTVIVTRPGHDDAPVV